jgi:hypothetical protein
VERGTSEIDLMRMRFDVAIEWRENQKAKGIFEDLKRFTYTKESVVIRWGTTNIISVQDFLVVT